MITLVVPCFNEQETIDHFLQELRPVLASIELDYEILFIDDGSRDHTLQLLAEQADEDSHIKVLSLSRHFGKDSALSAGFDYASGDAVIPIDVDLQDPVQLIPQMVEKWQAGADVVMARRVDRSSESLLKRSTAAMFYRLISALSSSPIPRDVGDYRLMDKIVVDAIRQLPEKGRFMKGLMSWPGFNSEIIEFTRPKRMAGESKWRLWKLINYALDGIFSFSTAPLRMWTYIGLLLSAFSLSYLLWIVFKTLIYGVDLPGYASIVSIILFFSGINLIGLGILGEYIGRVFVEVKQRPIYLVKDRIGF